MPQPNPKNYDLLTPIGASADLGLGAYVNQQNRADADPTGGDNPENKRRSLLAEYLSPSVTGSAAMDLGIR